MKRLATQQMLNDELVSIHALLLQMRADRAGHPVCVLPASWYTMLVGKNARSQGPYGAARILVGFWGREVRAPLANASAADVATCNVEVWGGQRLVLVPIKEEGSAQWLMTVVDVANRRFSFYNSFSPHDSQRKQERTQKVQNDIMGYFREHVPHLGAAPWTSQIVQCPLQRGTTDCGVFVLHFLRCVAEGRAPYMEQAGVNDMRVRLVLEINNLMVL